MHSSRGTFLQRRRHTTSQRNLRVKAHQILDKGTDAGAGAPTRLGRAFIKKGLGECCVGLTEGRNAKLQGGEAGGACNGCSKVQVERHATLCRGGPKGNAHKRRETTGSCASSNAQRTMAEEGQYREQYWQ